MERETREVLEEGGGGLRRGIYQVDARWSTPFVCLAPVYFYLEQAADH